MPKTIPPLQENKKPFHHRNGSGEINVFDAARYFEDSDTTLSHKHYMRECGGRLSLDIPNYNRRNSIPLKTMIMMDPNNIGIKNEKKHKQPSSPGGKLAHFLNSLFNQTSSKKSKSKSKSTTSTQSVKDEDESPSGWRRNLKRRSSISLFRSGNSNTSIASDTKPSAYNSTTTQPYDHMPQAPTKRASYKDLRSCSDNKPTCEVTKIPLKENYNKNENVKVKSGFSDRKRSPENLLVEKVRVSDVKHDDHKQKYDPTVEIREFKRFSIDDDDGDSDSSSDLFELTNCDLGYYSSGLPVFETTHMDSIKRGIPISS